MKPLRFHQACLPIVHQISIFSDFSNIFQNLILILNRFQDLILQHRIDFLLKSFLYEKSEKHRNFGNKIRSHKNLFITILSKKLCNKSLVKPTLTS